MFRCLKPVIGAINGPAVGIGATMTLPMDMRLASEHARFGFVFTRRGIVPEAASSWFLPRVVGISRAMEWVATGRVFDAAEALDGGLVRSVHPRRRAARKPTPVTAPRTTTRTAAWPGAHSKMRSSHHGKKSGRSAGTFSGNVAAAASRGTR